MKRNTRVAVGCLAATVVLSLTPTSSLAGQVPILPAQWEAFTRTFDAYADSDGFVGAAMVVLRNGRVVAHHEHGMADRARTVPVTDHTIFHYASITKTLTGIAIMQLRDRGLLALDDPVVRYVPELRRVHDSFGSIDSVTIRMLLSHEAGFQDPTWPYTHGKPWEPFEPTDWSQLVAMMPYQELGFKPGSRFGYSNPGFIYLGRVIEALTGDPWETYIQKNVFSPLELSRSYFGVTPYYLATDRSHSYNIRRDSVTHRDTLIDNGADFDPGITIPNGGWNGPLADVATYLTFLAGAAAGDTLRQRRYDTVLPHRDLTEMWQPRYSTNSVVSAPESIGLSFFLLQRGAKRFVGSTGEQAGFTSFLYLDPVTGDAVAGAFNTARHAGVPSRFWAIRDKALELIR